MTQSTSFWTFQLGTAWRNTRGKSFPARTQEWTGFARQMLRRHHSASGSPMVGASVAAGDQLTLIVLNHRRPQNVGRIVQYALRSGFIGRVIVANNSQAYPIEHYISVRDRRLVLINQSEPAGVGISMELARQNPSRLYLRVDDDIFLHPTQLEWIYWNLRTHPERPHGIFGAAFKSDGGSTNGWPFVHTRHQTGPVDILNGLFAFTANHLDEYFRLCAEVGIEDQRKLMNGEDIVLSFSGQKRPLIHDIGPIWECASEALPGVALHQTRPGFYEERWRIYSHLQALKNLAPEQQDSLA